MCYCIDLKYTSYLRALISNLLCSHEENKATSFNLCTYVLLCNYPGLSNSCPGHYYFWPLFLPKHPYQDLHRQFLTFEIFPVWRLLEGNTAINQGQPLHLYRGIFEIFRTLFSFTSKSFKKMIPILFVVLWILMQNYFQNSKLFFCLESWL